MVKSHTCAADSADSSKHLFSTPVLSMQSSTLTDPSDKTVIKTSYLISIFSTSQSYFKVPPFIFFLDH